MPCLLWACYKFEYVIVDREGGRKHAFCAPEYNSASVIRGYTTVLSPDDLLQRCKDCRAPIFTREPSFRFQFRDVLLKNGTCVRSHVQCADKRFPFPKFLTSDAVAGVTRHLSQQEMESRCHNCGELLFAKD